MKNEKQLAWGEWYVKGGTNTKYFPIHEGQNDILNSNARFRGIFSGVSAGKTSCGALDLMMKVQAKPRGRFLMVAPTFKILDSATLPTWLATIEGTALDGGPKALKVSAREYHLPGGGIIFLRSGEHPESFEGLQIDGGAWLDEGGQVSAKVWHAIQRRTGLYQAPILITTTPYPQYTWPKFEFIDRWKAGNPDYYVRSFPSILNPLYDRKEYERAKRELPAFKFKMFYEGIYCGSHGMVYSDMPSCFVDVPNSLPEGELYGGVDWGGGSATADPFVALVGVLDKDDCLWVFYERRVTGEHNDLLANCDALNKWTTALREKAGSHVRTWWADASRPNAIQAMRKLAGISIRKASNQPGSIAQGVDLVTARIRTGRLKILKTCQGLIYESELYRYPTGDDELAHGHTPVDSHNHSLDALRYLISGIDRKVRFPTA